MYNSLYIYDKHTFKKCIDDIGCQVHGGHKLLKFAVIRSQLLIQFQTPGWTLLACNLGAEQGVTYVKNISEGKRFVTNTLSMYYLL